MSWRDDLNYGLAAFGLKIPDGRAIEATAERLLGRPARGTAAVVAVSSAIFYWAEKDINPKVHDVLDAAIYCSTCLSVGYGDIFARTPVGKLLGTFLMTVGPSLSGRTLDGVDPDAVHRDVLAALSRIEAQIGMTAAK